MCQASKVLCKLAWPKLFAQPKETEGDRQTREFRKYLQPDKAQLFNYTLPACQANGSETVCPEIGAAMFA